MAVPAHDSRDYAFAKHFGLEIRPLIEGCDISEESFDAKEGIMMNSPRPGTPEGGLVLNGLTVKEAIAKTKEYIKTTGLGRVKSSPASATGVNRSRFTIKTVCLVPLKKHICRSNSPK